MGGRQALPLGWWTLIFDTKFKWKNFTPEQSATLYAYTEFGRQEYPFRS